VSDHRLAKVSLDMASVGTASPEIEHDRQVAIFDLVEKNQFHPAGAEKGPYELVLGCEENRLIFDVTGPDYGRRHMLSLTPFRTVLKDYQIVCESYYEAVRGASTQQIEAIDMGRRGLHDEGARLVIERLDGKIAMDHETGRRLFTLVNALQRRG
jgi:uncharacterized protein (UPF0262 family)